MSLRKSPLCPSYSKRGSFPISSDCTQRWVQYNFATKATGASSFPIQSGAAPNKNDKFRLKRPGSCHDRDESSHKLRYSYTLSPSPGGSWKGQVCLMTSFGSKSLDNNASAAFLHIDGLGNVKHPT